MKKRNIILFSVIAIFAIISFIAYKGYYLYYYTNDIKSDEYNNLITKFEFDEKKTIATNNEGSIIYSFGNISIRDDFQDFTKEKELGENSSPTFVKYDDSEKIKAGFWFYESEPYIEEIKSHKAQVLVGNKGAEKIDFNDFFEENNIKTDIDFYNYLSNNDFKKSNIFTSVKKMKRNYSIYLTELVLYPTNSKISLIDGKYDAYIITMNKNKEVNILKNNKRYTFNFINTDYFTDEYILDLISTIEIN